jgi:hypothetical protein
MKCPRLNCWFLASLLLACFVTASGCGGGAGIGTVYPVAGLVTLNDKPFNAETAVIVFKPDAARGNSSSLEPTGRVDPDGRYTLITSGTAGAPPGWYRVIVTAHAGKPQHPKTTRDQRPVTKSLLPMKYGAVKTSDLAIEVVEQPAAGAYDLKLRSQ